MQAPPFTPPDSNSQRPAAAFDIGSAKIAGTTSSSASFFVLILVTPPTSTSSHSFTTPPHAFSYIQVRGSVPLFWIEANTLRCGLDLQIMDVAATPYALCTHLTDLKSNYGHIVMVNLVNQVGYEKPVKEAFEHAVEDVLEGSPRLSVGRR
ncbi:hypothetical protein BDV93DRAFT_612013 [Ceratobasidium sp. AG-I]|nr:hypothetical protein BDV93DRAFT_612013 [Ceratobasidium sp. AG-I]